MFSAIVFLIGVALLAMSVVVFMAAIARKGVGWRKARYVAVAAAVLAILIIFAAIFV